MICTSCGKDVLGGDGHDDCRGPLGSDEPYRRIAEIEARLTEYRSLYRWFGQDDMTDGRFVAEFERIYLADRATK